MFLPKMQKVAGTKMSLAANRGVLFLYGQAPEAAASRVAGLYNDLDI